MVLPDEQQIESNQPVPPQASGERRRRGRRGGRRRGRGRGLHPSLQTAPADQHQPAGAPAGETIAPPSDASMTRGGRNASTIGHAIDEVRHIVESLEQILEQMEEVRELVELAERQKSADEREIESLRRALRRVQSPRSHKDVPHGHGRD